MAPKPDDDLFIEPADDDDVVYGDYNSTMDGASSSGQRPYIRLTTQLRNATRETGGEVRLRCEAIGTPPIKFIWLKNNAEVEKSRRVKIRNKESSSRLVISELDVLDSGYYQCIASNVAASVNSTSVLRVNNVPDSVLKSRKGPKTSSVEDYEDYELMDRGRLPDEEDADMFRVPDTAAGAGYVPTGHNERWLDGVKYRVGDCVAYRGEACRQYLSGRHVMLTSENREDMYDIDRNLRAAMIFINNSASISSQCRQISQAVACFHMYKICDGTSDEKLPLTICKKDCERIQSTVCPSEFALAAQHELVGDGPKALFPSCPALPQSSQCVPVLDPPKTIPDDTPRPNLNHWCYVNSGTTYEGVIATTVSGKACIDWKEGGSREFNAHRYPELRTSKNYCRNPGGKKSKPWCYSQPMGQEEYCDVPQCPKEMYPHLNDNSSNKNGIGSLGDIWDSLSSQWQLAVVGGGVFLGLLLLLLLCCACCCRSKKKQKARSSATMHSSQPVSVVNSAANSAYYRKLNGTSTPVMGRGPPMEMASLLPNQLCPPPYGDPFRATPMQAVPEEPYHIIEIPRNQLNIDDLIGEGQFGRIHKGQYIGGLMGAEPIQVAIKSVRENSTNAERASLEEEVKTIAAFDHPNVIRLLGVCYLDGGRLSAIFEYMVHGDLHDLLRLRAPQDDHDRTNSDTEDFLRIATQIAYGMEYLASMRFVHRDLATRNCLVGDNRVIKITDFGLMRSCYEQDYYKIIHRPWMPVRWMSKEALEQGRFTEASDVWSFGVTLWEIWSYGRQPYEGYSSQQVIELIDTRHLLECPIGCPPTIYSLMVECWAQYEERRPSFAELHQRLQTWSITSPAHSILNPPRNSASSQSGSSNSSRPQPKPLAARPYPPAVARAGRRGEDASPLMRRDANYAYSEDGDSD